MVPYYCFELLIQTFEFYSLKSENARRGTLKSVTQYLQMCFDAIALPEDTDQRRPFPSQDGGGGCQLEGGTRRDIWYHAVSQHVMSMSKDLRHSLRPAWGQTGSRPPAGRSDQSPRLTAGQLNGLHKTTPLTSASSSQWKNGHPEGAGDGQGDCRPSSTEQRPESPSPD